MSVMKTGKILTVKNPVIDSDFPDPDIIRVGNTYYMASTTMYFMPGCVILRSYDLVKWEIFSHAYKRLDNTPRYYMEETKTFMVRECGHQHFDIIKESIILYLHQMILINHIY